VNGPITIVAGGWSASQFDLGRLPGTIIGVNDAGLLLPHVDLIVSMDRLWAENRFDQLRGLRKPTWLRRKTLINIDLTGCPWVTPFENDHTSTVLADEPGTLNGTHSGFCALNLAYQLKPVALYLVGFDMQRGPKGQAHWFPPYPWSASSTGSARLAVWTNQFAGAAAQLKRAGIRTYVAHYVLSSTILPFERINRATLEARAAACAS
jgi:hypothetical protein